ncbi:MAG: DNA-processing protein DprA [bacterium]|jgi:DNA processing protein
MEREQLYWWGLSLVPGIGCRRFYQLLERYGSAKTVWEASLTELKVVLPVSVAEDLVKFRNNFDPVILLRKLTQRDIKLITLLDQEYPKNLQLIVDPPPVLYIYGHLQTDDNMAMAVVGSRRASPYGLAMAERFGRELAELGFTVVSGMARGVDSSAHRGCLNGGGRTIAVLGSGLDNIYPPENRKLAEKIAKQGAVITEFPLGSPPEAGHFPIRNRIISGLSLGVLVVEAAATSGSLITVDWALEQGREVFAVPGNINSSHSIGTNNLIKQGARLVEKATEIAEELRLPIEHTRSNASIAADLTAEELQILKLFAERHLHIDEIIRHTGMAAQQVIAILLMLELKGFIQQLPGKMFIRIS